MTFDSNDGDICVTIDWRPRELQAVSSRRPQKEPQQGKLVGDINFNPDERAALMDGRMADCHDSRRGGGKTKSNNASFSIPELVESKSDGWDWSSSKMSSGSMSLYESARHISASTQSFETITSSVSNGVRNTGLLRNPSTNSIDLSDIEDNSQEGEWENSLTYINENDEMNKKIDENSPSPKSITEFDSSYKRDSYRFDDMPNRNNLRRSTQNEDDLTRYGNASMNWCELMNDNTRANKPTRDDLHTSYTMQEDLFNYYRQRRQQEIEEKMSRSCAHFGTQASNNNKFYRQSSFRAQAEAEYQALMEGGMEAVQRMKFTPSSESTPPIEEDQPSNDTTETIEVSPGVTLRLRGAKETMAAIERYFYQESACVCCEIPLYCIKDAAFVLCPDCKTISPTENADEQDGGVGLGFKDEDVSEVVCQS